MTEGRRRRRPRALRPLTARQAQRAIYYDFEGPAVDGVPPMLLGACWLEDPDQSHSPLVFRQYILDPFLADLECLGGGAVFLSLEEAVGSLLELSDLGRRHLVSWSTHDASVIRQFTEQRAFRHRNAISTAKRWRRGRTSLGAGCPEVAFDEGNRLQPYLELIGYDVPRHVREGAGQWMRTIQDRMAGVGGDVGRLSPGGRQAWTNLVDHNRHDVLGMREVMLVATGLANPLCGGDCEVS